MVLRLALAVLPFIIGFPSCRLPSFDAELSALDAALSRMERSSLDSAFRRAYESARSSSEWLSILKRARYAQAGGDDGRYGQAARAALAARNPSAPVKAAAAQALTRSGYSEEAVELLGDLASEGEWTGLYLEAFFESLRDGRFEPAPERYESISALPRVFVAAADTAETAGRAADTASGALMAAAVAALANGDALAASDYARRALDSGFDPKTLSTEMAWDCGLFAALAARYDGASGARELALLGDAAWRAGDPDLARLRWKRAAALDPVSSWRSLGKLALTAIDEREEAESLWERMAAAAPREPASLVAYAAELGRRGSDAKALRLLEDAGDGAEAKLLEYSLLARTWPEGRIVAEALRFAEERPESALALAGALRLLAERGRIAEMTILFGSRSRRGLGFEGEWWYAAAAAAARGDLGGASAALESGAEGEGAYPAAFALGVVKEALGDGGAAAAAFENAAEAAGSGKRRCSALKRLGRVLDASGDARAAAEAFASAAAADPTDTEAAFLKREASRRIP